MIDIKIVFLVHLDGHLAISKDAVRFFISVFDQSQQIVIKRFIFSGLTIQPLIVGGTGDSRDNTKLLD